MVGIEDRRFLFGAPSGQLSQRAELPSTPDRHRGHFGSFIDRWDAVTEVTSALPSAALLAAELSQRAELLSTQDRYRGRFVRHGREVTADVAEVTSASPGRRASIDRWDAVTEVTSALPSAALLAAELSQRAELPSTQDRYRFVRHGREVTADVAEVTSASPAATPYRPPSCARASSCARWSRGHRRRYHGRGRVALDRVAGIEDRRFGIRVHVEVNAVRWPTSPSRPIVAGETTGRLSFELA